MISDKILDYKNEEQKKRWSIFILKANKQTSKHKTKNQSP